MASEPRCGSPFDGGARLCERCRLRWPETLGRCSKMVAESPAMRALLTVARKVAEAEAPVILLGETGTGKEVLARALHATSRRRDHPFVAVNCGAIPSELLESELFGHARGAFTGAVTDRHGLFEAADGGSLLLDEVGDLPITLQVKLLRVLQEGEVRRVGESAALRVDVWVMSATHRDLDDLVARGLFRQDLFYRLKVLSLRLPPLRNRREDVLPMARQFLATQEGKARTFSPEAEAALLAWGWPGNCRELESCARYAAALVEGEEVALADLPEEIRVPGASAWPAKAPTRLLPLATVEREHVLGVLDACDGRQADAARILGIGRSTLWRKLEAWRREAERSRRVDPPR